MKISAAMTFTLNLGNYQSAKFELGVGEVDTAIPLDEQLAAAAPYIDGTLNWLEGHLYERMAASALLKQVAGR